MNTELSLFDRPLQLQRFPVRKHEQLQAWDAGDEYMIRHVEELQLAEGRNILIIDDHFGALSCWFSARHNVTMMSDSHISWLATERNLQHNACRPIQQLSTMDAVPANTQLVLLQLPKNNRHLIWILSQLRQSLADGCQVIAVNKAREIHSSTLKLFEKYLGTTTTSLAWKKHRLVFSQPDCQPGQTVEPLTRWQVAEHNLNLANWPNVYSGESLDLGARFFLQHLPQSEQIQRVIDLGCGNGVLSVAIARLNPQAHITCVDESIMAVASARHNLEQNQIATERVTLKVNNCLDGFAADQADLVLCNPPFHQQLAITDHIAWQMFCDAKHVLSPGGQLLVIGNRHLGYDGKLKRLFGKNQVKTVAANNKFVVLQATK